MSPSEEFKDELTGVLNAKAGDKQLILLDGLMDKLLGLLMNLFDQCVGQLSPSEVAARVAKPSTLDKIRFRSRVRKGVYQSSSDYKQQGGQNAADSVFDVTTKLGKEKCTALVREMTEGENWWPAEQFEMG